MASQKALLGFTQTGIDNRRTRGSKTGGDKTSREKNHMLVNYLNAAMREARYGILSEDGSYYGEIPEFVGVYANAETLEACREELAEVLEEWLLFRISRNLTLPVAGGIELKIGEVA